MTQYANSKHNNTRTCKQAKSPCQHENNHIARDHKNHEQVIHDLSARTTHGQGWMMKEAIDFVIEMEGLSYEEAVIELSSILGAMVENSQIIVKVERRELPVILERRPRNRTEKMLENMKARAAKERGEDLRYEV